MIDLEVVFVVLIFGCILFTLQMLVDYNKRASTIRPQLSQVLRIKEHHKEEMEKVKLAMDYSEKEASQAMNELSELDIKHADLEVRAADLRVKVEAKNDDLRR